MLLTNEITGLCKVNISRMSRMMKLILYMHRYITCILGMLRHAQIPTKVHPIYFQKTYFIKKSRTRTQTVKESRIWNFRKNGPRAKTYWIAKNLLLTNLRIFISNTQWLVPTIFHETLQFKKFKSAYWNIIIVLKNFCL